MRKLILAIFIFTSLFSCKKDAYSDKYGPILVQIDNKRLYAAELEKIIHDETSSVDSAAVADAYIDRWIKEQLMIRDAQNFLSTDLQIEELVEDYRNQLIKYRYEQDIISTQMNHEVSDSDLEASYEKNKVNYLLDAPIYKVIYAEVPASTEKIDRLYNAWLNNEYDFIKTYCEQYADTLFLGQNEWIDGQILAELVPERLIKGKNLAVDRTVQENFNNNEYFFKVLDMRKAQDYIPLILIKEKLERLVLHERKKKVLHDYEQKIYEKGMRSNIVKIQMD